MNYQEAFQYLSLQLLRIYGPEEGPRTAGVVVTGILRDFTAMLEKAAARETMEETYRTEDGRTKIRLIGRKLPSGEAEIEDAFVSGG